MPTPPFSYRWCFSLQECAPDEPKDALLAKWLFGKEILGGCGSGQQRRQKEEYCGCDSSSNWQQMAGTKTRRGDAQWGAGGNSELDSRRKWLRHSGAQGCTRGRTLSPFCVNAVDMILDKLSWSRSWCVCVPLPV